MSTPDAPTSTADRPRAPRTTLLRRLSQLGFALFIIVSSARHHLSTTAHLASIDAYCPFGGFATLWRWITSGGRFVQKTHGSNLVLALGLIIGVILGGGAFCGWVCPLGALQDLLDWISRKLRLPRVRVPNRLNRILGIGRYLVLAGILYATISTARLWFADYDPYRALFSLNWLFEFEWSHQWRAYLVVIGVLAGGLFIPRLWCRYLCPLGAIVSLFGNLSFLRIGRNESSCRDCALCDRPCPVDIDVAKADPMVSANCVGCLKCLEVCPWDETLQVELGPPLLRTDRASQQASEEGAARRRTVQVNSLWMPALVIAALMGSVGVAKLTDSWETSGRGNILLDESGRPDPYGIKGWMTLGDVSETYEVPLEDLYALIGASSDIPSSTAMKDLEKLLPGTAVWAVREAVAAYQAGIFAPLSQDGVLDGEHAGEEEEHSGQSGGQGQIAPADGTPLPAGEIRGRFTLLETSQLCQVPFEVLVAELGLPADADPMLRLSTLPTAAGIEVSAVREVVAAYQESLK